MKTLKRILRSIKEFFFPTYINGKEWVDREMSNKYGEDWLDQLKPKNPQAMNKEQKQALTELRDWMKKWNAFIDVEFDEEEGMMMMEIWTNGEFIEQMKTRDSVMSAYDIDEILNKDLIEILKGMNPDAVICGIDVDAVDLDKEPEHYTFNMIQEYFNVPYVDHNGDNVRGNIVAIY